MNWIKENKTVIISTLITLCISALAIIGRLLLFNDYSRIQAVFLLLVLNLVVASINIGIALRNVERNFYLDLIKLTD
jgi:hypothetical protein